MFRKCFAFYATISVTEKIRNYPLTTCIIHAIM